MMENVQDAPAALVRQASWLCDESMTTALLQVLMPEAHPEKDERGKDIAARYVPTRMTDKAVDGMGVPRLSGEMLAYLDGEGLGSQRWRALYGWSAAKTEFYAAYLLRVAALKRDARRFGESEMTVLARRYGRSIDRGYVWLREVHSFLRDLTGQRLLANIERQKRRDALRQEGGDGAVPEGSEYPVGGHDGGA